VSLFKNVIDVISVILKFESKSFKNFQCLLKEGNNFLFTGCVYMKTVFVESGENKQRVYESLLLDSKHLGIFSSELAVKVINELAKQPMCAMDVAKKLGQNEQKVYYHLRKMRDAGIVKLNSMEHRYGMTAKMFQLVSPVIATKLYDDGYNIKERKIDNPLVEEFLKPFVENGRLNAKIILGSPTIHGKYSATARDGVHAIDLALFLGRFVEGFNINNYKLDIEVNEQDLNNNLIIVGNPKINAVTDKINNEIPVFFDSKNEWIITSKLTGNTYNYDNDAVILRVKNPFNKKKELILLAGRRSQGLRSAIIAFTRHTEEIMKGNIEDDKIIAKVVRGTDKESSGVIDSVTFLE